MRVRCENRSVFCSFCFLFEIILTLANSLIKSERMFFFCKSAFKWDSKNCPTKSDSINFECHDRRCIHTAIIIVRLPRIGVTHTHTSTRWNCLHWRRSLLFYLSVRTHQYILQRTRFYNTIKKKSIQTMTVHFSTLSAQHRC